jgi:hypothetical protein
MANKEIFGANFAPFYLYVNGNFGRKVPIAVPTYKIYCSTYQCCGSGYVSIRIRIQIHVKFPIHILIQVKFPIRIRIQVKRQKNYKSSQNFFKFFLK